MFQVLPPVPKRGKPLGSPLSGSLPDTTTLPSETQTKSNKVLSPQTGTNPVVMFNKDSVDPTDTKNPDHLCKSDDLDQAENRSQSLPYLNSNNNIEAEEDHSNQFGSLSITPSSSPKTVTCQTYSLHGLPEAQRISKSEQPSKELRSNPLYQPSEAPGAGPAQRGDGMYSQVPQGPTRQSDDTYELVPGEATTVQGNTYESLEDMKTKKPKSTWGKSVRVNTTTCF